MAVGDAVSVHRLEMGRKRFCWLKRLADCRWESPPILRILAAAYAETGRFADAVETALKALRYRAEDNAIFG